MLADVLTRQPATSTLVMRKAGRCVNSPGHGRTRERGSTMAEVTCSVDGCTRPVSAKSICEMHRWRWRKYGSFDLPQRACTKCAAPIGRQPSKAQRRVCDKCQGGTPQSAEYARARYYADVERSRRTAREWRRRNAAVIEERRRAAYLASREQACCVDCEAVLPANTFKRCTHCGEDHAKRVRLERNRRSGRARRARQRNVACEPYEPTEIAVRDGWRCQLCGKRVPMGARHPDPLSASIDHVVPLAEGGGDVRANVQLAHLRCNLSKSDRALPQGEQLRLIG